MFDTHIYIEGVDGTGKTSLVNKLREVGYKYVFDRSILTKISFLSIGQLPPVLPSSDIICDQILTIKKESPSFFSNRDIISRLNLDESMYIFPEKSTSRSVYIILDADFQICIDRINSRNNVPNKWDSEESIKYFRSKYLFISQKYSIPIIFTDNISLVEVFLQALTIINSTYAHVTSKTSKTSILQLDNYELFFCKTNFNSDLLDLELLHYGYSKIIYADDNMCIWNKMEKNNDTDCPNIQNYQNSILTTIVNNNLGSFFKKLSK